MTPCSCPGITGATPGGSPGPGTSAAPVPLAEAVSGPGSFRRCLDDGMNLSLWEEHGEIPRRSQSPVAGLAAELASCPHGIPGRPAPHSSAVVPDVHADRHAVSTGQLQRFSCDLFALGRVAPLVQELEIPAPMRPAVNPGDDVIDRGAARRVRQVIPAPRAAPVLRLDQFGHECQAVRCPPHNLVVILVTTSPGTKRPAAEPLPGRHRQPAYTAPARLCRHEGKLTGRSDIAAVADRKRGEPPRRSTRSAICCCRYPWSNFAGRDRPPRIGDPVAWLPDSTSLSVIWPAHGQCARSRRSRLPFVRQDAVVPRRIGNTASARPQQNEANSM
jgi:hypothetical protein